MNEKSPDFWIARGKYKETETEKLKIWLSGVFSYNDGKSNIVEFAQEFLNGTLDFNTIIGWFKIVIFDKDRKTWYLFGDNSNSQYFFYDVETGFSDSMLFLKEMDWYIQLYLVTTPHIPKSVLLEVNQYQQDL